MVTYSDLIQIGILIVGIIGLFLQTKRSNRPYDQRVRLLLVTNLGV